MIVFFTVLLTVATFVFVASPLWKQRLQPAAGAPEDDWLRDLQSRRDTTYAMLKELNFDYQSGLLTEDDYRDLDKRYKAKAISILKNIDRAETAVSVEDGIEQQVRALRQAMGPPAKPDSGTEQPRFCTQCGAAARPGDHFCASCGANLRQGHDDDTD